MRHLTKRQKTAYTAMSKHLFYFKSHVVGFVVKQGYTPFSPFGIFDYFVTDTVDRDLVRRANNNLVRTANELWVFGPVSDGVLAEIKLAKKMKKPIKYFEILHSREIKKINKQKVQFEEDLEKFKSCL